MPVKVHIYVATTHGLVAVQNMTLLEEQGTRSIVTIDGSAKLAGISDAYDLFVKSPTGLIHNHFGGSAYRINVDNAIDQGESWQLGFYLAHLLYANNQLAQSEITQGDIALCVTGAVSTFDMSVKKIEGLEKKIVSAKGQIMHWMSNGIMVQWIMPNANDVGQTLTLPCSGFGASSLFDCASKLLSRGVLRSIPECLSIQLEEDNPQLEMLLPLKNTPSISDYEEPEFEKNETKITNQNQKQIYIVSGALSLLVVSVLTIFLSHHYFLNSPSPSILKSTLSDSGICDHTSFQQSNKLDDLPIVTLPKLSLSTLCELKLGLDNKIKSVWLVSDSGALVRLAKLENSWQIPLPDNRRITRNFTLVLSERYLDEADHQSLNTYLRTTAQGFQQVGFVDTSERFDLATISPWFSQQSYSVNFIVGELSL